MSFVLTAFNPHVSYADANKFDCGHEIINKFARQSLKKQVRQGLSVAYALLDERHGDRFTGFYTITNYSIPLPALSVLELGALPKVIPCVRLGMLGVDKRAKGAGLGKRLMNHAFDVTKAGAKSIGSFGMYLDADAGAVTFYLTLGFRLLDGDKSPNPSPMFLPISAMG